MNEPTSDQCTEHAELDGGPHEFAYADWHPQWGGYTSHCIVSFGRETGDSGGGPGCFDVANYHDGEFPRSEAMNLHYCNAMQVINFGLTVLEQQLKHQKGDVSVAVPREGLQAFRDRIGALLSGRAPLISTRYSVACESLGLDPVVKKQLQDGEMWRVALDEDLWPDLRYCFPRALPAPEHIRGLRDAALTKGEPKAVWFSVCRGTVIGAVIVDRFDRVLAHTVGPAPK